MMKGKFNKSGLKSALVISGALIPLAPLLLTSCDGKIKENGKPNVIFILSDDLNWGDLGCYGQQLIKTPNLDRIANEGMRFTNAYSGSSVCAPSRCSLIQGKHMGNARVRENQYGGYVESLKPEDYTLGMLFKEAGYKTGVFGKWGLSLSNQFGIPNNKGFDEFFGYLNQIHAHCYYPEFLWHNQEKIYYPENGEFHKIENYRGDIFYDADGKVLPPGITNPGAASYSFDEYCRMSLDFVRQNKEHPFFLYLPYTIPHGAHIVPDLGIYRDMDWPVRAKEYAAMVTKMDKEVGKLLNLLEELNLDGNTIIFFTSDNGSFPESHHMVSFFGSAAPTRGGKFDTYHGAYHVPAIVRWPGKIGANQVNDHIWAFWDVMPTLAEIIGVNPPVDTDGISFLPTLLGNEVQEKHDYLYWEFRRDQSVRYGDFYALKPENKGIELYNIIKDPQQNIDLSGNYPELIEKIKGFMLESYTPSDIYISPGETREDFLKRRKEAGLPELYDNRYIF